MRNRQSRKRIEIYQTTTTVNEFGGRSTSDELITSSWANLTTLTNSRKYMSSSQNLGINDVSNTIVVKLRKRNDITYNAINQYIKYNGFRYNIITNPIDVDFNNSYIEFLATKQIANKVDVIAPIN